VDSTVPSANPLDSYQLDDRYRRESGRVFLTGTQALVRIPLMQRALDAKAGLNTAGLISGYRGSPLGGYDMELWRASALLKENNIRFLPAVNEELAATAILGSQQVQSEPSRTVDGVFGIWYGKGPGLDRAGDGLKHGNAYGSSPSGGVLVVAGDDHGCVSSSMPHQSDVAFLTWLMPNLNPSSVAEYLEFGLYGLALSRFSGMWVGFKAVSETVESGCSLELPPPPQFIMPDDFQMPPDGLHIRWPDLPGPQIEERLVYKKEATMAFAKENPIDRAIFDNPSAKYGIVTTGKAHLDLMEALRLLGIDAAEAGRIGIDVYKVGMVWPLAHDAALDFVRGKQEVLVVEEKRGLIESQFKEYFYDYPGRKPERMVGKEDEAGRPLVPWVGEVSPLTLAGIVAARLDEAFPGLELSARAKALTRTPAHEISIGGASRVPYFCSGCPHNTSTKVPEGSQALAGIGCHFMANWMDRDTGGLIQMGGEGVNWIARSMFNGDQHVFQNLGDGTFYHSGSLAIRQAIAAGTNITYKILFNDAVAMTGGQPVDGPISVERVAHSVRAEGVERIALISDDPAQFSPADFPSGTTISDRREIDKIQRELRKTAGVTVLIYAQMCATEKRRRRKRRLLPQASQRVVINDLVCEGCGDCSVESNCLSVVPKETPFGRKRQIDQASCNQDYTCLNGFCPSFVTVETVAPKQEDNVQTTHEAPPATEIAVLAQPRLPSVDNGYDVLVTGVGGTGVITVGAVLSMAAHLEGKGVSVLDFTGFAQKFGPVLSFLRFADTPSRLNQVRIDDQQADALLGCDLVVSSSPDASRCFRAANDSADEHGRGATRAVVNSTEMPTADFVQHRDASLKADQRLDAIANVVGHQNLSTIAANELASKLLGNSIYANVLLLGYAWQSGLLPVGSESIASALELNGVDVQRNLAAFNWGRLAAGNADLVAATAIRSTDESAHSSRDESLTELVSRRADFLEQYQNRKLADRYTSLVNEVRKREESILGSGKNELTTVVAKAYFKTLSYKDEYEVARLHTEYGFRERLRREYGSKARVRYHLAPPIPGATLDARGRPIKREFGAWIVPLFHLLAKVRVVRGSWLDVFGYQAERQQERALITLFETDIERLLPALNSDNVQQIVAIVREYLEIRGFGPVKAGAMSRARRRIDTAIINLTTMH